MHACRQGLPLPRRTPEDARRELQEKYLAYRLEGEAADVTKCGALRSMLACA
jgi:hypothetical protein